MTDLIRSINKILIAVILDIIIIYAIASMWVLAHTNYFRDRHIHKIYTKVLIQTGQMQNSLPLVIDEGDDINAYTDGDKVVIYRGLINYAKNDDEIAMVLGHELSHVMLRHVGTGSLIHQTDDVETQVSEANADKMGSVYMQKAGYDICVGREMWKRLRLENGNYLGANHPNYSYRYDELNIGCE